MPGIPHAAVKENDTAALGAGILTNPIAIRLQRTSIGKGAIGVHGRTLEQGLVPSLANGRVSSGLIHNQTGKNCTSSLPEAKLKGKVAAMSISKYYLITIIGLFALLSPAGAADRADSLAPELKSTYEMWRTSFVNSDYRGWQRYTAAYRQMRVRNQAVSEKRPFPSSVFNTPIKPPSLAGLKLLGVLKNGNSAAATYFGAVDFGVGGVPKSNPITLLFVREANGWKYDTARFFNLEKMQGLRNKLAKGGDNVLEEEGFQPLSAIPPTAPPCKAPRFIAKIFVDCPGRIVKASVNRISQHEFSDTRTAEVIWGGADFGQNSITLKVEDDPGAEAKGPLVVSVYLMPQIEGNLPVKAYDLQLKADQDTGFITTNFTVDEALLATGRKAPKAP